MKQFTQLTWLYNLSITVYQFFIKIASLRSEKAKELIEGREKTWSALKDQLEPGVPVIWIHSASTGEFEQAKPIIEQIKKEYPQYKILATFFSPSGFNASRNYTLADYKFYLPVDSKRNAARFIDMVQPSLVIFVKYEFWHHYLETIHNKEIPLLLISAIFRENQAFFKWYGKFYFRMLEFFTWIFVQDNNSLQLLQKQGIKHCSISGDTRFDRVAVIQKNFSDIPFIAEFTGDDKVIVAGSTWPGDETILAKFADQQQQNLKYIIAPHEIREDHIADIINSFPKPICYSSLVKGAAIDKEARTLIIDNIGMLSRLYRYATICYIGGGFTKSGIHNILEAAVFAKPVIIGPNYEKYREAHELIRAGGVFSVKDATALQKTLSLLLNERSALIMASNASDQYIEQNRGATGRIMHLIQEKRLLTR